VVLVFCGGLGRSVADSNECSVSPARWLSCGDVNTELGCYDDGEGHLLSVSAAGRDGMMSSDPELYSCSSMSVIHTTQPPAITGQPTTVNGLDVDVSPPWYCGPTYHHPQPDGSCV